MNLHSDNLPIGAEDDPQAPYNEVNHTRFVSYTVSGYMTVSGSKDMSESQIEDQINNSIESTIYNSPLEDYCVDNITVLDDNS